MKLVLLLVIARSTLCLARSAVLKKANQQPEQVGSALATFGSYLWKLKESLSWRENKDFEDRIYRAYTEKDEKSPSRTVASLFFETYAKDLTNRCLYIVKENRFPEYGEFYEKLCEKWGQFIVNHAHMSIKFFDVRYALKFFEKAYRNNELQLSDDRREREIFMEIEDLFFGLIRSEVEDAIMGFGKNSSQKMNFKVINSFYGPFFGLVFDTFFNSDLEPNKIPILDRGNW